VHLLVLDGDDHRHRQDPVAAREQVEEPRHDVRSFDHEARPLDRCAVQQRLDPHGHGGRLLAEAHDHGVRPSLGWFAQRGIRLERGRVQRRHQLAGEQRPHHLADRVGRLDAHDAQPRGELGRDCRLADAGRAADQHDERDVQRLDLSPTPVVGRIPIPRHVAEDRDRDLVELVTGHRGDPQIVQPLLDDLGHLVGANGREAGDHDLRRHQPLRVRQAVLSVGDQDVCRALLRNGLDRGRAEIVTCAGPTLAR
jgi:hypothetical protein